MDAEPPEVPAWTTRNEDLGSGAFRNGGVLTPGQLLFANTSTPEPVLNRWQYVALIARLSE